MSGLPKARLVVLDTGVPSVPKDLTFAFNPGEYTVAKSSNWTRPQQKGAKTTGKPEFNGANPQTLQMEIFLDAWGTEGPDVATRVATLFAWVRPTEESIKKKKPQPPILRFEWGGNKALQGFEAYLKTVSAKYLMFDGQGNPTRATASITLEEAPPTVEKQNPSSGAIHGRRTHIVKDGDSLQSVAWQEYDDPQLWRALADFNDIDDPLRVAPGTRLLIPSHTEASRSR